MRLGVAIRLCGYIAFGCGVLYGGYKLMQPRAVVLVCDAPFSVEVRERCRELLSSEFINRRTTAEILQAIADAVPGSVTSSLRHARHGSLLVAIRSMQPLVRINDTHVLTAERAMVPVTEFLDLIVQSLPRVHVMQPCEGNSDQVNDVWMFIQALPKEFFAQYVVNWYNKTHIQLVSIEQPLMSIVAWHSTRFTTQVMKALDHTIGILKTSAERNKRGARTVMIDVRIKNQMIIRHKQDGGGI